MPDMQHRISLEVNDMPGVLVRVAQIFDRRGCNISFVHVDHPKDQPWSHIMIIASNITRIDQIKHQLEKLVDVHQVKID
ncbi:MAG TPA: ACT domain-containing protein [Patescibacteria group bacterium]|nr:ACT domain-containing protein [Patescibacteria group bacterium]